MLDRIEKIKKAVKESLKNAADAAKLEELRVKYLGRKGELTAILRSLKNLSIEEKRKVGPAAQRLQEELEEMITAKNQQLTTNNQQQEWKVDITKPGKRIKTGHLHPLSKLEEEIRQIFLSLNFSVVEGPEIETDYYNFDALNIPPNHPARDMWDTFWLRSNQKEVGCKKLDVGKKKSNLRSLTPNLLLRTHTSPMQIRYMETHNPPFQIIVPGRVFRYEASDATHEINFHQVEGLMVGKDVSLANFKFIIETFLRRLFGNDIEFRYRPSYFPFVEPGLEVDIKIRDLRRSNSDQRGKNLSESASNQSKSEWLEIMGAGMVHPNVFRAVKYDPREWKGFAFGMGLERLAMIKYKIPDIRLFYSGDTRFTEQF
ncbi:phenylalanine--tRNA ligase subunit alpha [Candidatus Wolfebacteria bacterium]|nr:phenylalanine--tRNA ligase subunit alpha [Candidatus Wolfebacteria bacterium]